MADLSGQYLGRYYLSERLGEGGMAVVYKAYDTRLERDVAVKIIRSGAFPAEALDEISKRFEREAKSLAKLSHSNIVKVHDYGEHEGAPYLVMEYLPGGTLKKILGKPVPWQEALRLLLPVARGVAYAHQRGILHRDIKPANILITENGDPMLSDFGIAKLFEADQTTNLTGTGMVIGTPEYMAPEQWTGQTNPQSDLYSLGIVLYEMVAGRKPYMADTPASILLKQATEPLPPPRQFVAGLPEAIEFLLIKALAREPRDRFTDVSALIQAMETVLATAPTVQAPHVDRVDPDVLLKETVVGPAASIATQIEPPNRVDSQPSAAAPGSSVPRGHTIPPTTGQTGSARLMRPSRRAPQVGLFALFGGVGVIAMLGVFALILILMPSIMPKPAVPVSTATFSQVPPTEPATSTSTPGKTPPPELGFTIVEPQEVLKIAPDLKTLEELAVEKYSDENRNKVNLTLIFTVNSKPGVPMLWSSGWCAASDQILEENLTKMNLIFEVDGYVVPQERLATNTYEVTGDSNLKGWKCQEYLTVLRDWKPGTYKLVETIRFLSAINDGKDAFEAGNMIRKYTVNISQ